MKDFDSPQSSPMLSTYGHCYTTGCGLPAVTYFGDVPLCRKHMEVKSDEFQTALNAERIDAPNSNPNPLETAEQVIADSIWVLTGHPLDQCLAKARIVIGRLRARDLEITRTAGRAEIG